MTDRRVRMAIALASTTLVMGGCAGAPRARPVRTERVETGVGSLAETRKALEGTWTLSSLEVVDAGGARRGVKASGQLTYDAFGNMTVRGVIDDPAASGTALLDYSGRITIDPVRHEFYPAGLASDRPLTPEQAAAISPDKVRRYELSASDFVVTYLDASSTPTAVAKWRR